MVRSRDNVLVKRLRRLAEQPTAYRKLGQFWIEGDHLCQAALLHGAMPQMAVFSETFYPRAPAQLREAAPANVLMADDLFAGLGALPSPAGFGFVMALAEVLPARSDVFTVVLDRIQDAGNVGSILRSAAAFGFGQVLALSGTAGLWSPKVLRSAMGAHFALHLVEGLGHADVARLGLPLVVTSSHTGVLLEQQVLPKPCAWVFGHEGQGVSADLISTASVAVRIGQPGGEESLNVAAAAAICLHASARGLGP
ncbi:MAG: RNA methyltransferase [Burkholderiaceae bacterium]